MQILSQLVAESTPSPLKVRYLVGKNRTQLAQNAGQLRGLMHITCDFHKMWAIFGGTKAKYNNLHKEAKSSMRFDI